jgi:hypothetical protein
MSWQPEVIADSSGKWYTNALRFATKAEAEASAYDLACRWTAVRDYRAAESDDPVNYRRVDGRLEEVRKVREPDLVVGQCPDCWAINRHEPSCPTSPGDFRNWLD